MTDARWIGRKGEKRFTKLCSDAEVTCNPAQEDDCGWDFFIQFPMQAPLHVPIDERKAGPAALVQIKTTQVEADRWAISLQNALSLAKSPLPAFIVRIAIDNDGQETYRAIHIWRAELIRILTAARKAHVEGDEATNRRMIYFDFGAETERTDILAWMRHQIEEAASNYATVKQGFVDTLGFEEGNGVAHIRLGTRSPDALLDLQLGILGSLEVEYFSFTSQRFGIRALSPQVEVEGGRIEVIPQGKAGRLRLRAPGGRQVFLPAELFSASLPGKRRTKARIKAGCLDMILKSRGRINVKASLDPEAETTLDDIAAFALLHGSDRQTPIEIMLSTDDRSLELGTINMNGGDSAGWTQLLLIADALKAVAEFEGRPPIMASLSAIDAQFVPLSVLDALLCRRSLRVEFTPSTDGNGKLDSLLAYTTVSVGDHTIGAIASRPITSDRIIRGRRRIDFGAATILRASFDGEGLRSVREQYLDELDRMAKDIEVLAIGDLMRAAIGPSDRELLVDHPRRIAAPSSSSERQRVPRNPTNRSSAKRDRAADT